MGLQMDHPVAGDIAEIAALDRAQRLAVPQKPVDRVKTGALTPVDRHPLIPIAPVGAQKCAEIAHWGKPAPVIV